MSIFSKFKRHAKSEKGDTLVICALSLAVLMGISSYAVDLGLTHYQKSKLQNACDSAALAAAHYLPDKTAAENAAKQYLVKNGYSATDAIIEIPADKSQVRVKQSAETKTVFASIFGVNNMKRTALATAKMGTVSTSEPVGDYGLFVGEGNVTLGGNYFYIESGVHVEDRFSLNQIGCKIDGGVTCGSKENNWSGFYTGITVNEGVHKEMPNYTAQFENRLQPYLKAGDPHYNASYAGTRINWQMGVNYFNTWDDYCSKTGQNRNSTPITVNQPIRLRSVNNVSDINLEDTGVIICEDDFSFGWGGPSKINGLLYSMKSITTYARYNGAGGSIIAEKRLLLQGDYSNNSYVPGKDLYMCSFESDVTFQAASSQSYGLIYCPKGETTIQGNWLEFNGSVITKKLNNTMPGHFSIKKNSGIVPPSDSDDSTKRVPILIE